MRRVACLDRQAGNELAGERWSGQRDEEWKKE